MFGAEPLKPSNTGRLIADILPDTRAFLWSRTEVDPPCWRPSTIRCGSLMWCSPLPTPTPNGRCSASCPPAANRRCSLCWTARAEARKMFRKSPYLNQFPVFSSTSTRHRTTSCAKPAAPSNTARRKWRRPAATGGRSAGRRRIESAFPLFPSTVSGGKTDPAGGTGHSNVARKRLKSGVTSPKGAVHEPARVRSATTSQIDRRAGRFAAARPRRQPDDEQPAGRRIRRAHLAGHAALQGGMRRHGLPRRRQPAADAGSGDHLHPRQTQSGAD